MSVFDKVIGYEDIKAELLRFCDILGSPDKYKKLGVSSPRGILLYGVPGVGKTLMADSFIEMTGRKRYTIRKDQADGDFINHIREVFETAKENQPSVILLDDMDKFATEKMYNSDAEEYVTIQSCIDMVKDDEVFCVATCNDIDCLPESLKRAGRFDKVIEIRIPKQQIAAQIIEHYLHDKHTAPDVNAYDISRFMEGHSCAELEMVVNEAGIIAGFEGKEVIEQEDIVRACLRVIFDAPERLDSDEYDPRAKYASVHEAGHVVIAEVLEPGSVNVSSILRSIGDINGATYVSPGEDHVISVGSQENTVIRYLGGKAAVDVVFGTPDLGVAEDLQKAYDAVEKFIQTLHFGGFDCSCDYDVSSYWKNARDFRMTHELERYYKKAKKIIIENRGFFDDIADALLEKRTITFRDIEKIRAQHETGG
ncbi:MAG: AAA family ATPase [Lachnospiraceae bacterium]|nr:AAA family ATPase [Lachnospiraceae bacterium]